MRNDKQIYELTPQDLASFPLWYFPMDETVEDELTVRPLEHGSVPDGLQLLASCSFTDARDRRYPGYLYSSSDSRIEYLKPVLWIEDLPVNFWNGTRVPDANYMNSIEQFLPRDAWPVRFETTPQTTAKLISGALDGVYYLDDSEVVCLHV